MNAHWEGEQACLGGLSNHQVINHLLNGMILQVLSHLLNLGPNIFAGRSNNHNIPYKMGPVTRFIFWPCLNKKGNHFEKKNMARNNSISKFQRPSNTPNMIFQHLKNYHGTSWVFSLNGGTPKTPQTIISSRKTHGNCWGNPAF